MASHFDIIEDNGEYIYRRYENGIDIVEYRANTRLSDILSNIDDTDFPDPELPRETKDRLRSMFQVVGIDIREWI